MNFPHSATVRRTTKSGTKYTYGDAGTIQCFLQPLDNEEAQIIGATLGKSYYCYVQYGADVAEGDRLVIGSDEYGVKGTKLYNYGNLKHKRLVVELL